MSPQPVCMMLSRLCLLALLADLAGCSSTGLGPSADTETGIFRSRDGVELSYALDIPGNGTPPFPAVVMGHGSGPKTKADLKGFAQRMVDIGVAVLRYDKRGVGDSGGTFVPSSSAEVNEFIPLLAADMAGAADLIAADLRIDGGRVGLMGESQAGWVIPEAASLSPAVSFVIVLSGPTVPLGQVGTFEGLAQEDPDRPVTEIAEQVRGVESGYDPRPFLQSAGFSGLWVFGAQDRHVPVDNCVALLREFIEAGADFTVVVHENGDHALRRPDGEGIPWWDDVSAWVSQHVRE